MANLRGAQWTRGGPSVRGMTSAQRVWRDHVLSDLRSSPHRFTTLNFVNSQEDYLRSNLPSGRIRNCT